MSVLTARRYYLLKRRAALEIEEDALADVWLFKQTEIPWPDLPPDFLARPELIAAGYFSVRDLDGADENELLGLGLSRSQAQAVLAAMENWTMIPTLLLSPSYRMGNGEFAAVYNAPLAPSAARATSITGDTYEMGDLSGLRLTLSVTAVSGTNPTLDAAIETSPNGVDNWTDLLTFGQKTAAGQSEYHGVGPTNRFVRAKWAIGGSASPSVTFSITGEAL